MTSGVAACANPTTTPQKTGPRRPSRNGWVVAVVLTTIRECAREWCSLLRLRHDVEAEHHSALVVLGDVAVRHPETWVAHVQENVDSLPGADKHGVLPNEVRLDSAVSAQDEEAARAVDVERVMHRMVGLHLVDEPDLDLVADAEPPADRVVLGAGRPVELDHVVFPFDAAGHVIPVALLPFVLRHLAA